MLGLLRHEERMDIRGTATATGAYNILAGGADPSMMARATSASSGSTPLAGDVLRAVTAYNEASAASNPSILDEIDISISELQLYDWCLPSWVLESLLLAVSL